MHGLDEARLDCGYQRGMRVQCPVPANLAVQAQRLGIRRQQQFDRRGVESDAVVQALDAVFSVDALDRHHRHEHLDLGDLRRIAREQGLDVMRLGRFDYEVDPVARHIDTGQRFHAEMFCHWGKVNSVSSS